MNTKILQIKEYHNPSEFEIGLLCGTNLEDHKGRHPWNWLQRIVNLEFDNKNRIYVIKFVI